MRVKDVGVYFHSYDNTSAREYLHEVRFEIGKGETIAAVSAIAGLVPHSATWNAQVYFFSAIFKNDLGGEKVVPLGEAQCAFAMKDVPHAPKSDNPHANAQYWFAGLLFGLSATNCRLTSTVTIHYFVD